jgi:hypothetical protein
MNEVTRLHHEAMSFVDQSIANKLRGEAEIASVLLRKGFEKEKEAATLIASHTSLEPTRSVLFRSAASLALECDEIREAEILISTALSGSPPEEIADELRDLLEQVYFARHLKVRGVILKQNEFQFSIAGKAVGFGMTSSTPFFDRVRNVEAAVRRTNERLSGAPFRERGRPEVKFQKELELYVSVPRAASVAMSFKIGRGVQLKLPGMDLGKSIIDELFDCFDLFNSAKTQQLLKKIPDPSYYRNFVGLARSIAPDGEEVKTVGFTTTRDNISREVILTTTRKQAPSPEPVHVQDKTGGLIQLTGTLLYADARKGERGSIQIVDERGLSRKVRVPEGMMSDIVKPLWECKVTVTGVLRNNVVHLQDIEKAEE